MDCFCPVSSPHLHRSYRHHSIKITKRDEQTEVGSLRMIIFFMHMTRHDVLRLRQDFLQNEFLIILNHYSEKYFYINDFPKAQRNI
jgi:hypothetical protein